MCFLFVDLDTNPITSHENGGFLRPFLLEQQKQVMKLLGRELEVMWYGSGIKRYTQTE